MIPQSSPYILERLSGKNKLWGKIYNEACKIADRPGVIPWHHELKEHIDKEEAAPEAPVFKWQVGSGGSSEGVRRLNKVLYLIDAIPRKIAELRNKPLDLTQYEIAIEMIASCLPKIVGVEEWIANPRKFLDILGTGPCTFPCTLPCHGAVVVLAKCAAVVEMMVPSTWTGVVDTASSEWTGVVRAVWLMMMTIMRPMMKHSRYGTQRRVSSFS